MTKKFDWHICRQCENPDFIGHKYWCTHTRFTVKHCWKPDKLVKRGWQDKNSHFHFEGQD